MRSTVGLPRVPHRRPSIWRIVIATLIIAAIGEPTVMYMTLVREKEKRRAAEITLQTKVARISSPQGSVR
jgi:hypothetical protein